MSVTGAMASTLPFRSNRSTASSPCVNLSAPSTSAMVCAPTVSESTPTSLHCGTGVVPSAPQHAPSR